LSEIGLEVEIVLDQVKSVILFEGVYMWRRRWKWTKGRETGSIMKSFGILPERQYATVKRKRPLIVARSSPSAIAVRGIVRVLECAQR